MQVLKADIERFKPKSTKPVKILVLSTDFNLTIDAHLSNNCKTARGKIKSFI